MDHTSTVQQIYGAFAAGDVGSILGHLAEDVAWEQGGHDHGVPWLQPRRGKKDVAGFFEVMTTLRPDRFDAVSMLTNDRQVAVVFEVIETMVETGRSIADTTVHLWTFDDEGRVVAFRHFLDTYKHVMAHRGTEPE